MKSHHAPNPHAAADQESFDETPVREDSPEPETKLPKPVRSASGFDAVLFMIMGVGSVACGLALSLGPRISWKVAQISTGFKDLGVHGGVLIMGGLILTAIGLLRRGQIALRTPSTEQAEDRQMIEQLTKDNLQLGEDLSRMEGGLAHVEAELANSRRVLEERIHTSAAEIVSTILTQRQGASSEEAIFRLAASLDQVGMRIEQRLKTQFTALQDHLEDVGAAILSARNHMQSLQRDGEDHAAVLREEVQSQVENALEETGFWKTAGRGERPPSLGVLDTIEDAEGVSMNELASVSAALPLNPEEAREHGAATPSAQMLDAHDTKTRLIQLSTLLADPKLRAAIEGMRSTNP